jgi:hypothetical protein
MTESNDSLCLEQQIRDLQADVERLGRHVDRQTMRHVDAVENEIRLVRENEELRAEVGRLRATAALELLPHWTCPACSAFNGLAKENLTECRACGASRSTTTK